METFETKTGYEYPEKELIEPKIQKIATLNDKIRGYRGFIHVMTDWTAVRVANTRKEQELLEIREEIKGLIMEIVHSYFTYYNY